MGLYEVMHGVQSSALFEIDNQEVCALSQRPTLPFPTNGELCIPEGHMMKVTDCLSQRNAHTTAEKYARHVFTGGLR